MLRCNNLTSHISTYILFTIQLTIISFRFFLSIKHISYYDVPLLQLLFDGHISTVSNFCSQPLTFYNHNEDICALVRFSNPICKNVAKNVLQNA